MFVVLGNEQSIAITEAYGHLTFQCVRLLGHAFRLFFLVMWKLHMNSVVIIVVRFLCLSKQKNFKLNDRIKD